MTGYFYSFGRYGAFELIDVCKKTKPAKIYLIKDPVSTFSRQKIAFLVVFKL